MQGNHTRLLKLKPRIGYSKATKRQKQIELQDSSRQIGRFSPISRRVKRGMPNNRRSIQRKVSNSKNRSSKRRKQMIIDEAQDFNPTGYMAQLEQELEEQEASEEGEIRE